uniref:GH18 domain-containing protein n=1 Tax=Moniliophthora roreri TaxID=221103 RepID=A0A0W0FTC3_MONRR
MVFGFSRILSLVSVVSVVYGWIDDRNLFDFQLNHNGHVIKNPAAGKVQMAYFTNWEIYLQNFQPNDIDPTKLTHILYSFADVNAKTGEIKLTDPWANEQARLNDLAKRKGDTVPHQLSAAVAAKYKHYENIIPQMDAALDHWNIMAYDYAGSWLTYADNQANLYGGGRTNMSTDKAIKYYVASGVDASKIAMGIPLYGRAFKNTGGIGKPYSGNSSGNLEGGVYSYSVLPLTNASVHENMTDVTSYSYDSAKKELISYDTPYIVEAKTQYIVANGLAGTMFWELSTDKKGADNLVAIAGSVLGALDQTQNHISYPNSKWDNIRNNMGRNIPTTTKIVSIALELLADKDNTPSHPSLSSLAADYTHEHLGIDERSAFHLPSSFQGQTVVPSRNVGYARLEGWLQREVITLGNRPRSIQ